MTEKEEPISRPTRAAENCKFSRHLDLIIIFRENSE